MTIILKLDSFYLTGFCHLNLQRVKSHLYASDKKMLQDSGATQGAQHSMLSDKQLLPVSVEKATADVC